MPLIDLAFTLIIVGVLLWLVNRFVPMAASIKTILNIVVVVAVIWWLLGILDLVPPLASMRIG